MPTNKTQFAVNFRLVLNLKAKRSLGIKSKLFFDIIRNGIKNINK